MLQSIYVPIKNLVPKKGNIEGRCERPVMIFVKNMRNLGKEVEQSNRELLECLHWEIADKIIITSNCMDEEENIIYVQAKKPNIK